jgi:hypothetical protein
VKICNKKISFFPSLNQYFPHIPNVASKKMAGWLDLSVILILFICVKMRFNLLFSQLRQYLSTDDKSEAPTFSFVSKNIYWKCETLA